ncbi:MAG: hypothetical protein L0221_00960, partial [Chloroflexi bacterium]|nr:hypothetical protein [Chloroflexota bacterium]
SGGGESCILGANLEDRSAPDTITQLGYCRTDGLSPNRFIDTPNADGVYVDWPGSLTPVMAHRIRTTIIRFETQQGAIVAHYTLLDQSTGALQSDNGTWPGSVLDNAWWGAEVTDDRGDLGTKHGLTGASNNIRISYMIKMTNSGTWGPYATGLTDASTVRVNAQACEHRHITSWAYTGANDTLNVDNTC